MSARRRSLLVALLSALLLALFLYLGNQVGGPAP